MPSPVLVASLLALARSQDMRGEIDIKANALAVSPAGELWIGSGDGRLYVSRDWNRGWSEVDLGRRPDEEQSDEPESFRHIRFFDAERALVAGSVGRETKNEILRTADGGRTWERVPLGVPHGQTVQVADVQVLADGHAWMAASTGVLASADFGATWHYLAGESFEGAASCASVAFRDDAVGVVGAQGNALNRTDDGGRTWTWLETPIDALLPTDARSLEERELRIEGVWCLGERVVVLQHRRLFQRAIEGDGSWSAINVDHREVDSAVLDSDRLLVVTADQRLYKVSRALEVYCVCNAALEHRPRALAAGARGAAFVTDPRGRVCTLESLMLDCAMIQPGAGESKWPIVALDRTANGVLFGVSRSALYRSRDSGRSWERVGEVPFLFLYDVFASADGSRAIVKDSLKLLTWREGHGLATLEPEIAPSLGFTVQARRADLWIATGFEAAKDEKTQSMLCSSDTVLVGPGFKALVLASADEGLNWKRIDEYEGAIAAAAWFGNDDVLRLCMSDGTIRSGEIDTRDGAIVGGKLASVSADGQRLGGEWGTWIAFPDAQDGWVGGNGFFRGTSLQRTFDGGSTWSAVKPATREVTRAFRHGSGACVRVVGFWQEGSHVELWRAGEFQEIRRFETGANDARVDAGGRLLLRLRNGEVWSLAEDGTDWSQLGTIPVPER